MAFHFKFHGVSYLVTVIRKVRQKVQGLRSGSSLLPILPNHVSPGDTAGLLTDAERHRPTQHICAQVDSVHVPSNMWTPLLPETCLTLSLLTTPEKLQVMSFPSTDF